MAKQIRRSEIAEKDLYKEIRDSAKKTITQINGLNKGLKKTAEVLSSELSQPLDKTLQGLAKLDTQVTKMNTTMDQSIKLDKAKAEALKAEREAEQQLLKIEQERQKATQQKMNTDKKVRVETERLAKAEAKRTKGLKDQGNAYKQLVKSTRDQKNESKKLGAQLLKLESSGKKNTTQYRKLSAEFRNVTRSAQKGDKALKKLDKRVGDNFRNVGNYRGALGKLSGAFASLGLAMGGAMIIRSVFNTIKDFDQAQANLASVLGVSRDKMADLTEQSKELGATTRFTASQVSELQLEFAKLGFTQKEIEGMTESTLDLAAATGSDLGETATIVGATMRGFGLDVSETQRVTDVMSRSFQTSSLDMSKFSTAMSSVAPVAKLSGKTIEQTTALLGTLTDRGIDASTAGTGLRNMFLRANKAGLTFDEALEKIETSTDKVGTAMDLFGTRGATLGVVLSENGDDIERLTDQYENFAEGSTEAMADEQMKTLAGSIDLLTSAWQGFILEMDASGGVGEKLRKGLRFLADNLGTIMGILGKVIRAFIAYKTVMISMKLINLAMSTSFKGITSSIARLIPMTRAYKKEQIMLGRASKTAATGVKGLGKAMAGLGLGLAIGLVLELATAFYDVASGNAEARRQLDMYNKAVEKGKEDGKEFANKEQEVFDEKLRNINLLARIEKTKHKDSKKLSELEVKRVKDLTNAQKESLAVLEAQRAVNTKAINISEGINRSTRRNEPEFTYSKNYKSGISIKSTNYARRNALEAQQKIINKNKAANAELDLSIKDMTNSLQEFVVQGLEAEKDYSVKITDNTTKGRARNTMFRRSIDLQKEYNSLLENTLKTTNDILKVTNQQEIKNIDKKIKTQEKQQSTNIKDGVEFDPTELKKLIKQRQDLVIKGIEQTNDYIQGVETRKLDERFRKEREKIEDQYSKLLSQAKLNSNEKKEIEFNFAQEMSIIDGAEIIAKKSLDVTILAMDTIKNNNLVQAKVETNEKLLQVDNKRKEIINGIYTKEQKEFKLSLMRTKKTNEEVSAEMLKFDIEQLEKKIQAYKDAGLKTLDLEVQLEELKRQETLKWDTQTLNDKKALADAEIAIIQALTNVYNELADKRIAKIDEEIKKSQQRYDNYAALAKNGNITAKESMAVEAKLIADQNRLKEKEEKRKQRVQLASSVLQGYITNSANPDVKNPLAKTITDTVLLTQFIKSLPAFADGTEDTGTNGRGIDGKGGFQAILHPNERVLTKDQNKLVGGMTNEDLSNLAYQYQNGLIVRDFKDGSSDMINLENQLLLNKLDSLENTIKNKPETNIELEEIIGGAMSITRQTKQGNTKTYNRYRVN